MMAPVTLPTRPPLAPQIGVERPRPDAATRPEGTERDAFQPARYEKVHRPVPARPAATAPPPAPTSESRHVFTLQTLSAYAGLIVGQSGGSPAQSVGTTAPGPSQSPAGPPRPPGSRLNIKI